MRRAAGSPRGSLTKRRPRSTPPPSNSTERMIGWPATRVPIRLRRVERVVDRAADIFVLVVEAHIDFVQAARPRRGICRIPTSRRASGAAARRCCRRRIRRSRRSSSCCASSPSLRPRSSPRSLARLRACADAGARAPARTAIATAQPPARPARLRITSHSRRSQPEHVQHRGASTMFLSSGALAQRRVALARADQHGDVLLAVDRVGDRRRVDAGAGVEAPHLLQGLARRRPRTCRRAGR